MVISQIDLSAGTALHSRRQHFLHLSKTFIEFFPVNGQQGFFSLRQMQFLADQDLLRHLIFADLIIDLGIVVPAEAVITSQINIQRHSILRRIQNLLVQTKVPIVGDAGHHVHKFFLHLLIFPRQLFGIVHTHQRVEIHDADNITYTHMQPPLLVHDLRKGIDHLLRSSSCKFVLFQSFQNICSTEQLLLHLRCHLIHIGKLIDFSGIQIGQKLTTHAGT